MLVPLAVAGGQSQLANRTLQIPSSGPEETPLPTGRVITPLGKQTGVGSFPCNMLLSPDGRYLVVTNSGFRQYLTVLSVQDGHIVSQVDINGKLTAKGGPEKQALYYGLAWADAGSAGSPGALLFVSRGDEQKVARYRLSPEGRLSEDSSAVSLAPTASALGATRTPPALEVAGLAEAGAGLLAVDNNTGPFTGMKGHLLVTGPDLRVRESIATPGFPFAVAAADAKSAYVSSERDGVVSVIDTVRGRVASNIITGDHPTSLLFDKGKRHLYVANSGSDTISVIDARANRVARTILLRPGTVRGLAGATPLGMAFGPGERRVYVTLADMNAVAVVDLHRNVVLGYIPVGWYPTACAISPEGFYLFVANAKGATARNPNNHDVGTWGRYIQNIIEGTVSTIPMPRDEDLPRLTGRVLANNHISPAMLQVLDVITHGVPAPPGSPRPARGAAFMNPGISHVIYIIKENRTYDQVFGDLKQGDGDPSLCLFGRDVTPNQHALAERFALLDNFYDCAEVSADGWDWSTSGMISEYTARNAPYNYSGRGRVYDFEGQNNGVPVDLLHIPDVARAPCGYIWDEVARAGLSYRNYGFYLSFTGPADRGPEGRPLAINNSPNKRALVGHTDVDFMQFDLSYADSDAWVKLDAACPKQLKAFGRYKARSRFAEWKREFDGFEREGALPRFMTIRLPRDHTAGTSVGLHTPRAMVADNDYAVGQIVEAVSHSAFWKSTAIFVIEDDAQNGNDHVDAHRSTCLVISPYIRAGTVDHRFYNTDSVLRTMELLSGLPPMCQYDATAIPFVFLGTAVDNDAPYAAILPSKSIVGEVNRRTAYKARESERLDFRRADAVPDGVLSDIVWHSVKGARTPMPPPRRAVRIAADSDDR